MPLTDSAVRNAKPPKKNVKLFDDRGLFLFVTTSGGKWWRLKYRHEGKEKLLSLGTYPDTGLKEARVKRDEARRMLAQGIDPSGNRKAVKAAKIHQAANSFQIVATEWHDKLSPIWAESHSIRVIRGLERDIFPWLGNRPIAAITAPELLEAIRRIEKRGALETAHRMLRVCGQVMRYGVATGRAERDLTSDLRGALPPVKGKNFAAVTDPKELGPLLSTLDSYKGSALVINALRLAPLVFVRPGEFRKAKWKDIDLAAAEWRYDVSKTDTQHIVPLSTQAVAILKELKPPTGLGEFVFPNARTSSRPMSDNAVLAAMRNLGIDKKVTTGHGFRASARTILEEVLNFPRHIIEQQLSHTVKDPHGRAYNRTTHLAERTKMMQAWADYLDELKGEKPKAKVQSSSDPSV